MRPFNSYINTHHRYKLLLDPVIGILEGTAQNFGNLGISVHALYQQQQCDSGPSASLCFQ